MIPYGPPCVGINAHEFVKLSFVSFHTQNVRFVKYDHSSETFLCVLPVAGGDLGAFIADFVLTDAVI